MCFFALAYIFFISHSGVLQRAARSLAIDCGGCLVTDTELQCLADDLRRASPCVCAAKRAPLFFFCAHSLVLAAMSVNSYSELCCQGDCQRVATAILLRSRCDCSIRRRNRGTVLVLCRSDALLARGRDFFLKAAGDTDIDWFKDDIVKLIQMILHSGSGVRHSGSARNVTCPSPVLDKSAVRSGYDSSRASRLKRHRSQSPVHVDEDAGVLISGQKTLKSTNGWSSPERAKFEEPTKDLRDSLAAKWALRAQPKPAEAALANSAVPPKAALAGAKQANYREQRGIPPEELGYDALRARHRMLGFQFKLSKQERREILLKQGVLPAKIPSTTAKMAALLKNFRISPVKSKAMMLQDVQQAITASADTSTTIFASCGSAKTSNNMARAGIFFSSLMMPSRPMLCSCVGRGVYRSAQIGASSLHAATYWADGRIAVLLHGQRQSILQSAPVCAALDREDWRCVAR